MSEYDTSGASGKFLFPLDVGVDVSFEIEWGSVNPASLSVVRTTLSISLRVFSSIMRFGLYFQKIDKLVKYLLFLFCKFGKGF